MVAKLRTLSSSPPKSNTRVVARSGVVTVISTARVMRRPGEISPPIGPTARTTSAIGAVVSPPSRPTMTVPAYTDRSCSAIRAPT